MVCSVVLLQIHKPLEDELRPALALRLLAREVVPAVVLLERLRVAEILRGAGSIADVAWRVLVHHVGVECRRVVESHLQQSQR